MLSHPFWILHTPASDPRADGTCNQHGDNHDNDPNHWRHTGAFNRPMGAYRHPEIRPSPFALVILDKVRKQRMAYSRDVSDLQEKMYALNNLDFTFDLEQLIVNAIQHPEEHFLEYAERHIRKMPEAIEDLERLISKVKTEMDDNKE